MEKIELLELRHFAPPEIPTNDPFTIVDVIANNNSDNIATLAAKIQELIEANNSLVECVHALLEEKKNG